MLIRFAFFFLLPMQAVTVKMQRMELIASDFKSYLILKSFSKTNNFSFIRSCILHCNRPFISFSALSVFRWDEMTNKNIKVANLVNRSLTGVLFSSFASLSYCTNTRHSHVHQYRSSSLHLSHNKYRKEEVLRGDEHL